MTVSTTSSKIQYIGDGSQTAFAVPFPFLANTDLIVLTYDQTTYATTTKTLNADYTVSGAGNPAGGTVTFVAAPTTNTIVTILRAVPMTQLLDYLENDPFPAANHESALDKLTMIAQQLAEGLARAPLEPAWSTSPPPDPDDLVSTENVFAARIDDAADANGAYGWTQVQPVSGSNSWQTLVGGLSSPPYERATPLQACGSVSAGTVVLMLAINDSMGVSRYRFNLPGTCPS